MKALIVVDVQNDFCPGGALAVPQGDAVIPEINRMIAHYKSQGDVVVYTSDAHPADHCSFKEQGGIWPPHCIKGENGFKLHPKLINDMDSQMFYKAESKDKDAYSGFNGTTLAKYLNEVGVKSVVVVGLALDYCVKATALDAKMLGFKTSVALKGTRAVNVNKGDDEKAIQELKEAGIHVYEG